MNIEASLSRERPARSLGSVIRSIGILPWRLIVVPLTLYPIGILILGSFNRSAPHSMSFGLEDFTLQNYALLVNPFFRNALYTSLGTAAAGAAAALLIGLFFAWLITKSDFRFRGALELVVLIPFFVSPLMGAIAWSVLAAPHSGIINMVLREIGVAHVFNVHTPGGVIFVFALYYAPYAYLLLKPALAAIDGSLEEAAYISGGGLWHTLRFVVLPLIRRALLSTFLLVFASLVSLYAIPLVIGEPGRLVFMTTYLRRLLWVAPADYQRASALAVILITITVLALLIQAWLVHGRRFTTITGKGHSSHRTELGRAMWLALIPVVAYLLLAVVLPYFAIFQASFRRFLFFPSIADLFSSATITMDHVSNVWLRPLMRRSIINSLFVGFTVAAGGTLLCFLIAYVIQKTRLAARGLLEFLATMPAAVPSLVIGVAFLWAWIGAPFGLYGSIWIIVLAFVANRLPEGVQGMSNSLVQVDRQLEEAAQVCGSGRGRVLRSIMLPLVRPGAISIAVLIFILTVREIGPALFLYNSSTVVMAVQVLNSWEVGDLGGAAALSLVQSLIITVIILVSRYVFRVELGRQS
jgi:iron(III) transport system permease protein